MQSVFEDIELVKKFRNTRKQSLEREESSRKDSNTKRLNRISEKDDVLRTMSYRSLGLSDLNAPVLDDEYEEDSEIILPKLRRTRTEIDIIYAPKKMNLDSLEEEKSRTTDDIKSINNESIYLPPVHRDDDYEDLSKLMSKNINFAINQMQRKAEDEKSDQTSIQLEKNSSNYTMKKKPPQTRVSHEKSFSLYNKDLSSPELVRENSYINYKDNPLLRDVRLKLEKSRTVVLELSRRRILKNMSNSKEKFNVENFIESNKNINNIHDFTQSNITKKKLTKLASSQYSKTRTFESVIPEKRKVSPFKRRASIKDKIENKIKKHKRLYSCLKCLNRLYFQIISLFIPQKLQIPRIHKESSGA
jgi:hypothetical protein